MNNRELAEAFSEFWNALSTDEHRSSTAALLFGILRTKLEELVDLRMLVVQMCKPLL